MDNDTDDDNVDNGCKDKDEDNINDGNKHEDEDNISNGSNNEDGDEDDDGTVEDNDEDVDAEDESDTATIAQEKTRTAAENRPNEVESPCMQKAETKENKGNVTRYGRISRPHVLSKNFRQTVKFCGEEEPRHPKEKITKIDDAEKYASRREALQWCGNQSGEIEGLQIKVCQLSAQCGIKKYGSRGKDSAMK